MSSEKDVQELRELLVLNLKVNSMVLHAFSRLEGFQLPRRTVVELLEKVKDKLEGTENKSEDSSNSG